MTRRRLRQVPIELWPIADALENRGARLPALHGSADPISLLETVKAEADHAATHQTIRLRWKSSCDFPGYFRVIAVVPVSSSTFDQLFNGRSGYRAQYYLSPEEGVLYNSDLLSVLTPAVKQSYDQAPVDVKWTSIAQSLAGPHSKVWVFNEKLAFDQAQSNILNPPRWVQNGAIPGRKVPLPMECAIDVKGAFIHPETMDIRVDEAKADRACDLFCRGYT